MNYSKIGGDYFWLKKISVDCIMSAVWLIEVLLWNTYPSFAW